MGDHRTPGSGLGDRLMARTTGLQRRSMEDGGEVFSGPVARQALRAVGARAMTLDKTIIVDDDFDSANPEDQALYAHERFHQMESGGDDHPTDTHDAEEMGARAIERMVLHRAEKGEALGSIMRDAVAHGADMVNAGPSESAASTDASVTGDKDRSEAEKAYTALRKKMSHQHIVDMLAHDVVMLIQNESVEAAMRSPSSSF